MIAVMSHIIGKELINCILSCRYVTISKEGTIESDGYAFNIPCGERMKGGKDNNATRTQQAMGGDGKLPPSGRYIRTSTIVCIVQHGPRVLHMLTCISFYN